MESALYVEGIIKKQSFSECLNCLFFLKLSIVLDSLSEVRQIHGVFICFPFSPGRLKCNCAAISITSSFIQFSLVRAKHFGV